MTVGNADTPIRPRRQQQWPIEQGLMK